MPTTNEPEVEEVIAPIPIEVPASTPQAPDETLPVVVVDAKPSQCALINDDNVFVGMVDYPEEGEETDRHLLDVNSCDLPLNEYVWDANEKCFHPLKARNQAVVLAVEAINASIKVLQKSDVEVPLDTLIWLKTLQSNG